MLEFDCTRLPQRDLSGLWTFVQMIVGKVEEVEVVPVVIDSRPMKQSQGLEGWIYRGQRDKGLF